MTTFLTIYFIFLFVAFIVVLVFRICTYGQNDNSKNNHLYSNDNLLQEMYNQDIISEEQLLIIQQMNIEEQNRIINEQIQMLNDQQIQTLFDQQILDQQQIFDQQQRDSIGFEFGGTNCDPNLNPSTLSDMQNQMNNFNQSNHMNML